MKNLIFGPIQIFCPIWRFKGFWHEKNERKHILHRNRPRVSKNRSHQMVGSLKIMILTFLESPFITKWSLDLQMGPWIFSKHQGLLVERPSAKNHFEKWPQKTICSGKLENLKKSSFVFIKRLPFYVCFRGWAPFGPLFEPQVLLPIPPKIKWSYSNLYISFLICGECR